MEAAFTVTLQQERKGTHMSRFIEVWDSLEKPFSLASVTTLLNRLEEKLDAEKAQVELKFPLFFTRTAPVSKAESLMDFNCEIVAASNQFDPTKSHYELRLMAPVTSLCPCSKEISEFSAHSQRSHLTIALQFRDRQGFEAVDIDQLLMEMESVGSSRLYPLLKRPDEKYVTEMAYKTPVLLKISCVILLFFCASVRILRHFLFNRRTLNRSITTKLTQRLITPFNTSFNTFLRHISIFP